jgi:hypothetical protein
MEKSHDAAVFRWRKGMIAAYQFVIGHAAVGQNHGAPCFDPNPGAERQARSKHYSVQQIALEPQ